jgi:hypothetical protein
MTTPFWLNDISQLIDFNNINFLNKSGSQRTIMLLNLIASVVVIIGVVYTLKTKKKMYIKLILIVLTATILIKFLFIKESSSTFKSKFSEMNPRTNPINSNYSNSYDTGVSLVRDVDNTNPSGLNNTLYVNQALNFNKGDIIALATNASIMETCIINDVQYTTDGTNTPVLVLLNPLKNNYTVGDTRILKVSDSSPNLIVPPDPNVSIQQSGNGTGDPQKMAVQNFPVSKLPYGRYDWNLELSSYGGSEPGKKANYEYQGPPFGPLKCRSSSLTNPMGTINVTEYDSEPTMYGTCNVQVDNNDNKMTTNQEATVSQRVDDLLFHKGNSQAQFSPVPVDTMPNDQEAFAHFCYRSPTNLVNPKYASVFVNDPDKFLLVSKLARATGTENGGGGGR